ncbi:MAG: putative molybdenum carrier protein [Bacteroidota bacterium]
MQFPEEIISGGQTGVDRAAMDAAMECGIRVRGWCPAGRRAEDGRIAKKYPLTETASADYTVRTRKNTEDADALLLLYQHDWDTGTNLAVKTANRTNKEVIAVDLASRQIDTCHIAELLKKKEIRTLNIAGPRESNSPGIYNKVLPFLLELFRLTRS